MEQAAISYPVLWEQSMNTVLCQELARFNNLTNAMKKSLVEVEKAVRGIVVMSGPLEALGDSLVYGAIPLMWKVCCPRPVLSRRFRPPRHRRDATQSHTGQVVPCVQAARRLRDRSPREIELLTRMAGREAASHLLDLGVLLPARLMTASKQNYSRAETIPIDAIGLQFEMLQASSYAKPPALGVYVYGFFFEGARWDKEQKKILESDPRCYSRLLLSCGSNPKGRSK